MTERHALAEGQELVAGRIDRRGRDPEALRRAQQQQRIAERLGRREHQQTPCVVGERLELADEALLDPSRERVRRRQPEPARQLRRGQPAREARATPAGSRASPR